MKNRDETRPRSRENPLTKVSGRDPAIGNRLFRGGYAVNKLRVSPVQGDRQRKRIKREGEKKRECISLRILPFAFSGVSKGGLQERSEAPFVGVKGAKPHSLAERPHRKAETPRLSA